MKLQRFAFKALNQKDEPILVTLELLTSSMEVAIKTYKIQTTSDDEVNSYIQKWNAGEAVDDSHLKKERDENRSFASDSFLPEDIKADNNSGLIRQKQNEWSYILVSEKLYEQFITELEVLKDKANHLTAFDHDLFNETRDFWEKLLEYKKEREISQETLNQFKEEVNEIFEKLKNLKGEFQKELDETSEKVQADYDAKIAKINEKLTGSNVFFKDLIEEIKTLQKDLKDQSIKRDVKQNLYEQLQKLFQVIVDKRSNSVVNNSQSRIEGLTQAKDKINKSLQFDLKDLKFNEDKLKTANNRLEEQLREAKINVLKDKIESKQAKIDDIQQTLDKLVQKSTNQKSEKKEVIESTETKNEPEVLAETEIIESSKEETHEDPTTTEQ